MMNIESDRIWFIGGSPVRALVCVYLLSFFSILVLFALYQDVDCLLAAGGVAAAASLRYILVLAKKALLDAKENGILISTFNHISCHVISYLKKIIQPFFEKLSFKIKVMNRHLADFSFSKICIIHVCISPRITKTPLFAC